MNSKEGFTSVQGFISESGFNSFEGFTNGGSGLGEELQVNWDMSQGLLGWNVNVNASLAAINYLGEDCVRITLDAAVANQAGLLSISGIESGKDYRVLMRACIGSNNGSQTIGIFNWGSNTASEVNNTAFQDYELTVTASSVSGNSLFRVSNASAGAIGDELYISQCSIREIL